MKLLAMILYMIIFAVSCLPKHIMSSKRKLNFDIALPPSPWVKKSFPEADYYFINEREQASITINSQCERLSDAPHEALLVQLLSGLGAYEIISEHYITIKERQVLLAEVSITLDGISSYVRVMIYKQGQCVIDAWFSAPKASLLTNDFDNMINSLLVDGK